MIVEQPVEMFEGKQMTPRPGYVIWLTGVSGSGKTTLARLLEAKLREVVPVALLDGDEVRNYFENDLGYTREDRIANVRRIAFAADMLARHGIHTIVANIAPYYEVREFIRRKTPLYLQVYLRASLKTVRERDPKGLYQEPHQTSMVGVDDPYEEPRHPDLVLDTTSETQQESFEKLLAMVKERILS